MLACAVHYGDILTGDVVDVVDVVDVRTAGS